jgi:hypothetical protein
VPTCASRDDDDNGDDGILDRDALKSRSRRILLKRAAKSDKRSRKATKDLD